MGTIATNFSKERQKQDFETRNGAKIVERKQ